MRKVLSLALLVLPATALAWESPQEDIVFEYDEIIYSGSPMTQELADADGYVTLAFTTQTQSRLVMNMGAESVLEFDDELTYTWNGVDDGGLQSLET